MTVMLTHSTLRGNSAALLLLFICTLGTAPRLLAGECNVGVAQAVSVQGRVEQRSEGAARWSPVHQGDKLCPGDRLRVGANSRAGLNLNNETLLRLAQNSSIRISAPKQDGSSWLDLLDGVAHFISRVKQSFQVNTPYVNASIEGTEFTVETASDRAAVTVLEGKVKASNAHGEVLLNGGQKAIAQSGEAPRIEQVVDPLKAVQWTLYYPPVTDFGTENSSAAMRKSIKTYRRGDIDAALSALAQAGNSEQDAAQLVYRASLHLRVGGVGSARRDLTEALRLEPAQADALALMSIIATVTNEPQQALELAQQAVAADPRGLSPLLALSYARQAQFQLPEALEAARKATESAPQSALAWARLAQLHLMFRQLDAGSDAAWRAADLAPDQPETLATLGFAELLRLNISVARQAFDRAIRFDQAAPLPRLGLGLLEIRKGKLAEGRHQLEIAANLDPGNALIRSYLGKAYYEEKRDKRAATQFGLAEQFDERDPTPWFYDAILKQSENRPIEALNKLQTSIDLNDNRAVYRSRFLLDQDEAARNASQARIYQDLGFEQLARTEAYKSLQTSAETHSAHRLLSDSYSGQPLFEKARRSELLQSQLLQPLNSNPIQPQLAASKLGILDGAGPSASGFSEYTPLFTRNGLDLQFDAIDGNTDTQGDDLILSGLHDKIAFSLGQFHYESNGWRENNDLKQDIYNAFLQFSLTPTTSLQLEFRHQKAESGDLAFSFEPDDFSPIQRNNLEHRTGRIGIHHQFETGGHLVASVIDQDILDTTTLNESLFFPAVTFPFGTFDITSDRVDTTTIDSVSRTRELQFSQPFHDHKFTLGGGHYSDNYTWTQLFRETLSFSPSLPPQIPPLDTADTLTPVVFDPSFKNVYLYSQLALTAQINLTLGATHEKYEDAFIHTTQTNPKLGLTWEARKNLTFRAAYLKGLARPLHMERTIEQTQVAGFNQIFDDGAGSEIKQSGIGVDSKLSSALSVGAEFNRRNLQVPYYIISASGVAVTYDEVDEKRSRAYLYWMATDRLSIRLSHEREEFEQKVNSPQDLTTDRTPLGFSYYWPSGIFLQAEGTYVDQKISQSGVNQQDNFWNLDTTVGYRFPKRYGKAEIIVKNLLDEQFNYYDLNFYSSDYMTPRFQPERQIFARFTVNF
jgi:ferric-dicitrate binding protein FerR (iron transport regulator)